VFEHPQNPRGTPYSEFQIYDILNGRLRLTFDYTPLASTRFMEWPWGFRIDVLEARDYAGHGNGEVVLALGLYAADAIPTYPVIVRWNAGSREYNLEPTCRRAHGCGYPGTPPGSEGTDAA